VETVTVPPAAAPAGATTAYERDIAFDLLRRGALVAPLGVALGALTAGRAGAIGVALGVAVVCFNFLVAGALQSWAATKGSPGLLGGTVLASLLVRFVVVIVALVLASHASFLNLTCFGLALVVSHLGLLIWEAKAVRLQLAFPGLRPPKTAFGGKD
jgi:hypothetical protein